LNILVQHPGRQFKAIEGRRTPFTTTIVDLAQLNSKDVEEVVDEFEDLFLADEEMREWDEEDGIPESPGWDE
jgi:hypothetical protein